MLHIVLGIVAIGLILFLWERFPSFKWIFAAIVSIPVLILLVLLVDDHNAKKRREKEEAEFHQRYEEEQKSLQAQKQNQSIENLKNIKDSIDRKIAEGNYSKDEDKQQDLTSSKQLQIWINQAKKQGE